MPQTITSATVASWVQQPHNFFMPNDCPCLKFLHSKKAKQVPFSLRAQAINAYWKWFRLRYV